MRFVKKSIRVFFIFFFFLFDGLRSKSKVWRQFILQ